MGARERFELTRKAVIELDAIHLRIMYQGEDWKPDNVKAPGISDPTASAAIHNVDVWEEELTELRKREGELTAFIGLTLAIIRAVRDGLGNEYASIIEQRYIDCLPWRDVVVNGQTVKKSTGKLRVSIVCDWVDSIGLTRLLRGDVEV